MAEQGKEETTEAFLERFGVMLTHGFASLAISLGVHTGLFDALAKLHQKEATVKEIADTAGLKERYVKEWLGVMVTSRIVDINPETELYRLPPHRIPCLQTGSKQSELAIFSKAIPMLADVYPKMVECLQKDGPPGLAYSNYTSFHEFMANLSGRWVTHHLVQDFIPSMPTIEQQLKTGIRVLDLGCGRGVSTNLFAESFPNSSIVGVDFSEECISFGKEEAKNRNLNNVDFICCDAAAMPAEWESTFDYIYTFDVIHDLAHADKVLLDIQRVLKVNAVFSMLEPDSNSKHSENAHMEGQARTYTISLFHCLPISLFFEGSVGLGTAWGRQTATQYLRDAGLQVDSITKPPGSNSEIHYMCSKAS